MRENAKVRCLRTVERCKPETEHIHRDAGNYKKEQVSSYLKGGNEQFHIDNNDDTGKDEGSTTIHTTDFAPVVRRVGRQGVKDNHDHQESLPCRIKEPAPEHPLVEVDILQADPIQRRSRQQDTPFVLFVPGGEPNDWYGCKHDIVGGVELEVVDLSAWEGRHPPVKPDWHHQQDVLVEHVADCIRVATIVLAAVVKQ